MGLQLIVFSCSFFWERQQCRTANCLEEDTTKLSKKQVFLGRRKLVIYNEIYSRQWENFLFSSTEMFDTCLQDSVGIATEKGRDCKLGRFNGLWAKPGNDCKCIKLLNSKTALKTFKSCSENLSPPSPPQRRHPSLWHLDKNPNKK